MLPLEYSVGDTACLGFSSGGLGRPLAAAPGGNNVHFGLAVLTGLLLTWSVNAAGIVGEGGRCDASKPEPFSDLGRDSVPTNERRMLLIEADMERRLGAPSGRSGERRGERVWLRLNGLKDLRRSALGALRPTEGGSVKFRPRGRGTRGGSALDTAEASAVSLVVAASMTAASPANIWEMDSLRKGSSTGLSRMRGIFSS